MRVFNFPAMTVGKGKKRYRRGRVDHGRARGGGGSSGGLMGLNIPNHHI